MKLELENNEFKINKFITIKQENDKVNIYVNNKKFSQCKYLLINIPINQIQEFDEINSIDEAAELLDHALEGDEQQISIETEFWGHSSNLQAWAENNYDTRLLHSNLAFPLLKELYELGDLQAKKVFKEEIAKRLTCGYEPIITYLLEEGYLDYLSQDEIESLTEDLDFSVIKTVLEYPALLINDKVINYQIQDKVQYFIDEAFDYNLKFDINKKIEITTKELIDICKDRYSNSFVSKIIRDLSEYMKKIFINATFFQIIHRHEKHPHRLFIDLLNSLRETCKEALIEYIVYEFTIFDVFGGYLCLSEMNIKEITKIEGLERLVELFDLDLSYNNIREIRGLGKQSNLEILDLSNNKISEIKGLGTLNNLRILNLSNNKITIVPDSLLKLPALKELYLINCPLEVVPELASDNLFIFTSKDIKLFQKETSEHTFWNDKATNAFKKWYKLNRFKKRYNCTKEDIERFRRDTGKRLLYAATATKAFKKWLHKNKKQSHKKWD
ncbi:hypothetical protein LCGC14_2247380 [marine sediment metagenome]|uniref:Leucine-rich repeat domain-containing protein n=1 Tax=marine sediment metagenome TaxID=412755 RepID=A0A0F9DR21_9ZZZZ